MKGETLVACIASVALVSQASAEDTGATKTDEFDVRAALHNRVFDPAKFFRSDFQFDPLITIRYTGDDWDWPVYSIALFKGCLSSDTDGDRSCYNRYLARMVRAPWNEGGQPDRPRWRGSALVSALHEKGVSSNEELNHALDDGAVEWMETDLTDCPAALAFAKATPEIEWFVQPIIADTEDDEIRIVIHYDTVELRFTPIYSQALTYVGEVDQRLPSGWAVDFAASLEECWKPASALPPWRRAPIANADEQ